MMTALMVKRNKIRAVTNSYIDDNRGGNDKSLKEIWIGSEDPRIRALGQGKQTFGSVNEIPEMGGWTT